jgi:hypothetical protein
MPNPSHPCKPVWACSACRAGVTLYKVTMQHRFDRVLISQGEVLSEALPEALKNMLLVLHSKVGW